MKKCGFVAVIGRPNVGKSTLVNKLVGEKVSITTRRPQTTRQRVMGVSTEGDKQAIYIDTPGIHKETSKELNKLLNREAKLAFKEADVILFIVAGNKWLAEDDLVCKFLQHYADKVILVINKRDLITDTELLAHVDAIKDKINCQDIVAISATKNKNLKTLQNLIDKNLPNSEEFYFPISQKTDKNLAFITSEIIREKALLSLSGEVPYDMYVKVESIEDTVTTKKEELLKINALIVVDNVNHKKIVIGEGGVQLKTIGERARKELEKRTGKKVFLKVWVKINKGWFNDKRSLSDLGFND